MTKSKLRSEQLPSLHLVMVPTTYYIGEEIKLTGTNTDITNVFLFVTGQNIDYNYGIVLESLPTQRMAAYATSPVSVKTENNWEGGNTSVTVQNIS